MMEEYTLQLLADMATSEHAALFVRFGERRDYQKNVQHIGCSAQDSRMKNLLADLTGTKVIDFSEAVNIAEAYFENNDDTPAPVNPVVVVGDSIMKAGLTHTRCTVTEVNQKYGYVSTTNLEEIDITELGEEGWVKE